MAWFWTRASALGKNLVVVYLMREILKRLWEIWAFILPYIYLSLSFPNWVVIFSLCAVAGVDLLHVIYPLLSFSVAYSINYSIHKEVRQLTNVIHNYVCRRLGGPGSFSFPWVVTTLCRVVFVLCYTSKDRPVKYYVIVVSTQKCGS